MPKLFKGQSFLIAEHRHEYKHLKRFLEVEGATLVTTLTAEVDHVVLPHRPPGRRKVCVEQVQAEKLNASGASIQIHPSSFLEALEKDCKRMRALAKSGDVERFIVNCPFVGPKNRLGLTRVDLSGRTISETIGTRLVGANFREAKIEGVHLSLEKGAFDGAVLRKITMHGANSCDLRKADVDGITLRDSRGLKLYQAKHVELYRIADSQLKSCHISDFRAMPNDAWNEGEVTNCDFSKSRFESRFSGLKIKRCVFDHAVFLYRNHNDELCPSRIDRVTLEDSSLKSIELKGGHVEHTSFKGSDFRKAALDGSSFIACSFVDADLRNASVAGALFMNCDFTGAQTDGLNVDGTILYGDALDVTGCKNRDKALLCSSKYLEQLDRVMSDPDARLKITYEAEWDTFGGRRDKRERDIHNTEYYISGAGTNHRGAFSEVLVLHAIRQPNAILEWDTLKCKTTKCSLKGKEMKAVVQNAFREAYRIAE